MDLYLQDMGRIAPEIVLTLLSLVVLVWDLVTKGRDVRFVHRRTHQSTKKLQKPAFRSASIAGGSLHDSSRDQGPNPWIRFLVGTGRPHRTAPVD